MTDDNNVLATSKSLVDKAFQDLYGFSWGTTFQFQSTKQEDPTTQLLIQMLGRTSAARILRYTDHVSTGRITKNQPSSATSTRSKSVPATKPIPHKKEQHVKHTTSVQSTQNLQHRIAKPRLNEPGVSKPAGVDQLLQQLEGSGKVSTIAKTSSDWEHFKEKSGLGERLEEQADSNTSYLQKQDFLHRVDNRTFEVERKEREKQRGK